MTAYLVGFIDSDQSPPTLCSVGIYSEDARSLTTVSNKYSFGICEVTGYRGKTDYHNCCIGMIESIADKTFQTAYKWLMPYLRPDVMERVQEVMNKNNMHEALE